MAIKGAKKTLNVRAGIWWHGHGEIGIATKPPHDTISTVSGNPKSERYHPNLYKKLGKLLKDAGFEEP